MINGNIKWTEEAIKKEALKYDSRSEFWTKNPSACHMAIKLDIFEDVCSHMKLKIHKKWTEEEMQEEAKKYNLRKEFKKKSSGAYDRARDLKILDEICFHMKRPIQTKK